MDKLKKFELMEKITNELTDLKHSQTAVIQKIGKIEVDNMELNNKKLTDKLPVMHQKVADILDDINEILMDFDDVKNSFEKKNDIEGLREQEAIDSIK